MTCNQLQFTIRALKSLLLLNCCQQQQRVQGPPPVTQNWSTPTGWLHAQSKQFLNKTHTGFDLQEFTHAKLQWTQTHAFLHHFLPPSSHPLHFPPFSHCLALWRAFGLQNVSALTVPFLLFFSSINTQKTFLLMLSKSADLNFDYLHCWHPFQIAIFKLTEPQDTQNSWFENLFWSVVVCVGSFTKNQWLNCLHVNFLFLFLHSTTNTENSSVPLFIIIVHWETNCWFLQTHSWWTFSAWVGNACANMRGCFWGTLESWYRLWSPWVKTVRPVSISWNRSANKCQNWNFFWQLSNMLMFNIYGHFMDTTFMSAFVFVSKWTPSIPGMNSGGASRSEPANNHVINYSNRRRFHLTNHRLGHHPDICWFS